MTTPSDVDDARDLCRRLWRQLIGLYRLSPHFYDGAELDRLLTLAEKIPWLKEKR